MQIKVKLDDGAVMPQKATEGSSGYDLVAIEHVGVNPGGCVKVRTGIRLEIPEGWEGQIRSRSGLARYGVVAANSPGTIDSDYRGEVCVLLRNHGSSLCQIAPGNRIAQIVFQRVPYTELIETDELTETSRGGGGFGSTGT